MTPEVPLRLLLVEDSPIDARLIEHELTRAGLHVRLSCVEAEAEYLTALDDGTDVVLCDYELPQFNALRALDLLRARAPHLPFLIVSGTIEDEAAIVAMKRGANDYLLKDRLGRLGPAIAQALEQQRLREGERKAQEALRASEAQYRMLAESIPHIVWTARADGVIDYVNQQGIEFSGMTHDGLDTWKWPSIVHPEELSRVAAFRAEYLRTGKAFPLELRLRRADGEYRWHVARHVAVRDAAGEIVRWFCTCTDMHDQKIAADTLRANEARWRRLLSNLFASVALLEPDGTLVWANRALLDILGASLENLVGRKFWEISAWGSDRELSTRVRDAVSHAADGGLSRFDAVVHKESNTRMILDCQITPLRDETDKIVYLIPFAVDVTEREVAVAELRLRDRAIHAASQGILIGDATLPGVPMVYASPGFERLTGYSSDEVIGRSCNFLQGRDTDPKSVERLREAIRSGGECLVELWNYRKDGTAFWNSVNLSPVRDGDRVTHFVGVQTDMSDRRRLEEQYRQAQKMEAFGQLAGGIAHDFNNILCVINVEAEILQSCLTPEDPQSESVAAIREAGAKASGLTAQLLSFSRKTIVELRVLDLNEIVERLAKMLRRLLGEDVQLELSLSPALGRVSADEGQIEQVIMNLAVNARDAMPRGGRLTITTEPLVHEGRACVGLSITDTGIGMSPETRAKIFEPFFTTKPVGKGTGLGLATVYGIVTSCRGTVSVVSEPEQGTTFTIKLPAVPDAPTSKPLDGRRSSELRGTETVLVVEDEPAVRRVLRLTLEAHGYDVLEADGGVNALVEAKSHTTPIHLLITDVVMPGMGGREVAERITALHPSARVLYTSGYTDDAVVRNGIIEATDAFLQKPFSLAALVSKVRDLLDGTAVRGDAPTPS